MFVLGQPGTGKSALVKRLVTGAVAVGTRVLVLGDTKPDYTRLVAHLGGQVIRIGRGLDKINPLDAGPLGTALARMTGPDAERLRQELRSRRLALLLALRHPGPRGADQQRRGSDPRPRHRPARRAPCRDTGTHRHRRPAGHRGGPGRAAVGRPRRHAAPVPGAGRRPGVHARPAVHRVAGRGVRRRHLPADRPGRPGRVGGHLGGQGRRGQAADRGDAVHLELRVRRASTPPPRWRIWGPGRGGRTWR